MALEFKIFIFGVIFIFVAMFLFFNIKNENMCRTTVATLEAYDNNILYREEIKQTIYECLEKTNNNRDVVFNDSNEIVKSCQLLAYKLYNGKLVEDYELGTMKYDTADCK